LTSSINFTAIPGQLYIGQRLEIRLSATTPQANFDNVRLTGPAVPEPSALVLAALGGLTLLAYQR
jgi:hypothetical protein